jgi:DNA-binding response OmpR family regulator
MNPPATPGSAPLAASKKILIVVRDSGFRQSLEFALEVEGYSVESHEKLAAAEASPATAALVIVDESALRADAAARGSLERLTAPVILLVDGLSSAASAKGLTVLTKPVQGNDLIDVVQALSVDCPPAT